MTVVLSRDMKYNFWINKTKKSKFNPIFHGILDYVAPMVASEPSPEIKEGVISDTMLLYNICYLVYLGVTCKISARNLKIWARFQDFKILGNWDFASPWQMKNLHNSLDFEGTGLSGQKSSVIHYVNIPFLARVYCVPAVGVRAVDCWQWRSGNYNHEAFPFLPSPPVFLRRDLFW